ncbi:hypothetical protein OU798_19600 [Prolixibacteraceae bacterium Z1-6]|uniref:Uncharacterized protein n=1 Tax=Draconibacterium aestuarii TaxID=2998507 RepID=A0A9X3J6E7_9BACT|nr:hypothetical protein [Prolixibacteraceae bacterium Z1-6]
MKYNFHQQRELIAEEIERVGNSMIETTMDKVVSLIRQTIIYFVLLVVVLFGVPFVLGFSFGRMRLGRKKE